MKGYDDIFFRSVIVAWTRRMCSKNIFFTLGFWVGLPQNLGFDFSVKMKSDKLPFKLCVKTPVRCLGVPLTSFWQTALQVEATLLASLDWQQTILCSLVTRSRCRIQSVGHVTQGPAGPQHVRRRREGTAPGVPRLTL